MYCLFDISIKGYRNKYQMYFQSTKMSNILCNILMFIYNVKEQEYA